MSCCGRFSLKHIKNYVFIEFLHCHGKYKNVQPKLTLLGGLYIVAGFVVKKKMRKRFPITSSIEIHIHPRICTELARGKMYPMCPSTLTINAFLLLYVSKRHIPLRHLPAMYGYKHAFTFPMVSYNTNRVSRESMYYLEK